MLVYTIQRKDVIKSIRNGGYTPLISKSPYNYLSYNFSKAYLQCLNALSVKTNRSFRVGIDGCYWGWVSSPDLSFYSNLPLEDYIGVLLDINPKNLIFTDYTRYCDFCYGDSRKPDFFLSSPDRKLHTQCCFWELKLSDIVSFVELGRVKKSSCVLS